MTKNVDKIRLSYSTINELFAEPHTYLNKIMGIPRHTSQAMEEGKSAHKIIQEHVSGKKLNPLLDKLPQFGIVETMDRDSKTEIKYQINDKYYLIGYADGIDLKTNSLLEVKSGKKWTPLEFARLMQWRLYLLGLPDIKTVYLVNTPRLESDWNSDNIRIFKTTVVKNDIKNAKEYLQRAIYMIENIKDQNLYPDKKSYFCNYIGCSFCPQHTYDVA